MPLLVEDVAIPRSKYDQVLVSMQYAGVCHSDLHLWEGGYAGPEGSFMNVEDRGVKFLLTAGHKVAGAMEDVGESIKGFQNGDKVIVYPWVGEGLCPACKAGEEPFVIRLVRLASTKMGEIIRRAVLNPKHG